MLPHTLRMLSHTLHMLPHTLRMLSHTLRVPQVGEALRKTLGQRAEAVPVQRQPLHTAADMFKGPLRLLYVLVYV
jgi:hypothetical protein